jgi:uncharacterized protein YcaQ
MPRHLPIYMKLSTAETRLILLSSQGLAAPKAKKGTRETLSIIEHLGYVQIDTLSVVARAHHHTLWSRNPDYQEKHLSDLLEKKNVFEYWSHAAAYLPMSEFRFSLVRKDLYAKGKKHWSLTIDPKMKKHVLDRIRKEGPLQSRDFEHPPKAPGSWYTWKPAKRALEQLFMEGKLMVASRKGFQKVYDLSDRVLPDTTDTTLPTEAEYSQHLVLSNLRANGLMNASEISYLQGHTRQGVAKSIKNLMTDGKIIPIHTPEGGSYYGLKDQLDSILQSAHKAKGVHILSPFDNLIIQRKRLSSFFGYDYVIECYVPEAKRIFGYFCLPVLDGDRFVARFDPKADRATGLFHIKKWHGEKNWKPTAEFASSFALKLKEFASFSGCETIVPGKDMPAIIRKMI